MFLREKNRAKWLQRQTAKLSQSAHEYPIETTVVLALMLGAGPDEFYYGAQNPPHGHDLFLSHQRGRDPGGYYWNFKWIPQCPESDLEVKLLAREVLNQVAVQFLHAGSESPLFPDIMRPLLADLDDPIDCLLVQRQLLLSAEPPFDRLYDFHQYVGDGEDLLTIPDVVPAFMTKLHDAIPFSENEQSERVLSRSEALLLSAVLSDHAHALLLDSLSFATVDLGDVDTDLLSLI